MRLSVHSGLRISLSLLSALVLVLPFVLLPEAQADWLVRESAELAPLMEAAPQPSAEPAPQASEEKLAAPQQPAGASSKCGGCTYHQKETCQEKKSECNATSCPTGNATGDNAAELMESTMKFRIQSLAQVEPDDSKVVGIVGAKITAENPKLRREAVGVLGLLSSYYPEKAPEVYPYLIKGLNDSDPNVHSNALKALIPTVAHLQADAGVALLGDTLVKGNSVERTAVAAVVANLTTKLPWMAQLSDALRTALDDPNQDTKLTVIMALVFIDPDLLPADAVSMITKNTQAKSPGSRFQAYGLLAALGPKSIEALPELLKGVDDPHYIPRWAAVRALGSLGRDTVLAHPEIIEALIKATGDQDVSVQQIAALELGKNLGSPVLPGVLPGEDNPAALEALQKLLQSQQRYVSETAAWALVRISPKIRGELPENLSARLPEITATLDTMVTQ